MRKPTPTILKFLADQGRQGSLPLNVLREFQEFEKLVHIQDKEFDLLPPPVAYGMRCFSKIEMLGMALATSGEFKAADKCLNFIMKEFNDDSAFSDGVTLLAWFLFNFPTKPGGKSLASEVLSRSPELSDELKPFIEEANLSRLGLYEMARSSKDSCVLKELFTGREVQLNHSLATPLGNIALLRVMRIMDKQWVFGDQNEFPAERKSTILGMVSQKMAMCFPDDNPVKSYEQMMRMAGPYWFSIVANDYQGDIIDADYVLDFYEDEEEEW